MIKMLQETTDWGLDSILNGIYHVNKDGQLVAYQAPGSDLKVFNKPMKQFSKTRRKFTQIGEYENG